MIRGLRPLALSLLLAGVGRAEPLASTPAPPLHHAPLATAYAGEPLQILADVQGRDLVRSAWVVYRRAGEPRFLQVELRRGPAADIAEIPAAAVAAPAVEYAIEVELVEGGRQAVFASREAPHRVAVSARHLDLREAALLQRLEGRRSAVALRAEAASFGATRAAYASRVTGARPDRYVAVESTYTYRPLRTVTEFSVGVGILRGDAPTRASAARPGASGGVGMNWTAPSVLVRLGDSAHLGGEAIAGVTEQGFRLGWGGSLHLGDPYGTKLVVGLSLVEDFGERYWSRLDLTATPWLRISPRVEATTFPHASYPGMRLLLDAAVDLG
ncbi:MAG: hypothetical protein FJ104_11990, partial [Deltaproteobacteria bacterium]|nr:hypothetical protein [Deltaproteobacteria bacterium]